jgi:hypothetical protein
VAHQSKATEKYYNITDILQLNSGTLAAIFSPAATAISFTRVIVNLKTYPDITSY